MHQNDQTAGAFLSKRRTIDQEQKPYFTLSTADKTCSIEASKLLRKNEKDIGDVFGWALLMLAQKTDLVFVINNLLPETPVVTGFRDPTNARTVFDMLSHQLHITAQSVRSRVECEMTAREDGNYDLLCTQSWSEQRHWNWSIQTVDFYKDRIRLQAV